MKSYVITVNGIEYDVTVEEKNDFNQAKNYGREIPEVIQPPVIKPAATPVITEGTIQIEAGAAGKVIKLLKNVGDVVEVTDSVAILEIMKMETPVVSSESGTITNVHVSEGQAIEAGQLLYTLRA